jgi:hypothetical protein
VLVVLGGSLDARTITVAPGGILLLGNGDLRVDELVIEDGGIFDDAGEGVLDAGRLRFQAPVHPN